MPKIVWLEEIGEITLSKRRGVRSLRLSVNLEGRVRVSMPHWVPYSTGVVFAKKRKDWILLHKQKNQRNILQDGSQIGRSHTLNIVEAREPGVLKTLVSDGVITVTTSYPVKDELVQNRATIAAERALRIEAEHMFPVLLNTLAHEHNFDYDGLNIRKLTSRWGSCSSKKVITLSYYLVQLPDEFIKYVMLHELVHTKHLNHSSSFWVQLEKLVPDAKLIRKKMNDHKPRLEPLY